MNELTDRATIFANWPDGCECFFPFLPNEPVSLKDRIEYVRNYAGGFTPIAWSEAGEWSLSDMDGQRAESIAAGRIIKQIDGKWVAFGAEPITPEVCYCGEPEASGVVHRTDAPCYYEDSPDVDTTWRPALTWADSKPFDAFKDLADWTVQSETHPDEPTPVHALQRLAEGDPRCGSAWLLKP